MTPLLADVLTGLGYSVAGFILGYFAGHLGREMDQPGKRSKWRPTASNIVGVIILVLIAYTTITGVRVARCQAGVNALLIERLTERGQAASTEREGQRTLLATILDPTTTKEQRTDAIRRYLASLSESDQQRDAAPYPEGGKCGG